MQSFQNNLCIKTKVYDAFKHYEVLEQCKCKTIFCYVYNILLLEHNFIRIQSKNVKLKAIWITERILIKIKILKPNLF